MITSSYESAFVAFANTIYDTNDLSRILDELNLIERALFKDESGTISQKAKDYLSSGILIVFRQIEETGLEPDGDQKQLQFLKDLVSFLQNIPIVKVTLAFEPNRTFVIKLSNQISAIVSKKIVVDVIIDENVIGGAIFEYNGRASEQTLKDSLRDVLVTMVEKAYKGAS